MKAPVTGLAGILAAIALAGCAAIAGPTAPGASAHHHKHHHAHCQAMMAAREGSAERPAHRCGAADAATGAQGEHVH